MSNRFPAMVVPFAIGRSTPTISCSPNGSGTTENCLFLGFGDCNSTPYSFGNGYNWETGERTQLIDPSGNTSFTFQTASDITSVDIYMDVLLYTPITFTTGDSLNAYVALAVANSDSNIFRVIPETKVECTMLRGVSYSAGTLLTASKTNIPVEIPKGTRVGIVGAISVENSTAPGTSVSYLNTPFNFTGGIAMY